jgi:PP-loop superfamily ATP-utilizing enzyme
VEWQTKVIPLGSVRETLTNQLKSIDGSVRVSASGGIDSSVLVISCLDLGYKPHMCCHSKWTTDLIHTILILHGS